MITITINPEKEEKRNIFFKGNVVVKDSLTILVGEDGDNYFHGTILENNLSSLTGIIMGDYIKIPKNNCHQFYGTVIIESL